MDGSISSSVAPGLALCCGASGRTIEAAAANWQAFGLQHLVFGDTGLMPAPQRLIRPEVPTTRRDEPCLSAMLVAAAELTVASWLLLLPDDAHLTPAALRNLAQLVRPGASHQLVIGRAWRLPPRYFRDSPVAHDQAAVDGALADAGCLDPPSAFSWALLPRGALLQAPREIGTGPDQALPWLVEQAALLGWPVLEASSVIPVLRPASLSHLPELARPRCTGVVLPHEPGAPRLSVLLAAPAHRLDALVAELAPAPSLPWEVIVRADDRDTAPGSTAAAWNSALEEARGDLIWPLTDRLPSLPLLPAVMRAFDAPWVDLLQLGSRVGSHHLPAADPHRLQPGCLVVHRSWWRRLGGLDGSFDAAPSLKHLLRRALERGACWKPLPLEAHRI